MQVQTPFYVIKRTAATKETALALWSDLLLNDGTLAADVSDLIDFCLGGPKDEKVFLSLGDKVRLKENDGWRYYTPTSGEAVLAEVTLAHGQLRLQFGTTDGDFNGLIPGNMNLSDYVELI